MRNRVYLIASSVFLILGVIIAIFLERTAKGKKVGGNKKLKNVLVYTPLTLFFACFLYYSTEFISDFIYVLLSSMAFIGTLTLWERCSKNYKYKRIIEGILVWSISFAFFRFLNKNLIIPIGHHWIWATGISTIRIIFTENDGKTFEKFFLANIVGLIILLFMFKYFSEPYGGFGKPEVVGKKYLIENGIAKKEDKIEINRLTSDDENIIMFIYINGKPHYTLSYELGKINNIEKLQ